MVSSLDEADGPDTITSPLYLGGCGGGGSGRGDGLRNPVGVVSRTFDFFFGGEPAGPISRGTVVGLSFLRGVCKGDMSPSVELADALTGGAAMLLLSADDFKDVLGVFGL